MRIKLTGEEASAGPQEDLDRRHREPLEQQVPHRERPPARARLRADLHQRQPARVGSCSTSRRSSARTRATGTSGPTANSDPSKPPDSHDGRHRRARVRAPRRPGGRVPPDRRRVHPARGHCPDGGRRRTRTSGFTVPRLMSAGHGRRRGAPPQAVHRLAEREQAQRREAVQAGRRAVTELLASFAAAGGAPPPSHEVVRVLRDGSVRALAGTVWPGLGPISEAGAYAFELDGAALAELERLAEAAAGEELDGPLRVGLGAVRARRRRRGAAALEPVRDAAGAGGRAGRPPARAARRGPRAPARGRAARGGGRGRRPAPPDLPLHRARQRAALPDRRGAAARGSWRFRRSRRSRRRSRG